MKVLYDHQTYSLQEYGGISRLYTELLRQQKDDKAELDLSILFSNNAYLDELKSIRYAHFFKKATFKYKVGAIYNLNKLYCIAKIKTASFDVFHPTYYDPYFLKFLRGKPFVVTVLDMIHEKLVDRYNNFALDKNVAGKKILLEKAARVIAISESTKNDIVEVFGTHRDKIQVIHLGSSMKNLLGIKKNKAFSGEYILFVGNRKEYKNFNFFLESIVPLLISQKTISVYCGGGGRFSDEEDSLIEKLGLKGRVIFIKIVNDETFSDLYSNAICFVFPSLYEGFGIPVLEAFSCGCPCALSDRTSLPEVGGNAAVYFNPESDISILNTVSTLVNDIALRREKVEKGYERLSIFSWSKMRKETLHLYETLI